MEDSSRHSLYAAVLSPEGPDRSCDTERLSAHCKRLLAEGCDGIAIFGTTGEGPAFSVEERMSALEALLDAGVQAEDILVCVVCAAPPDMVRLMAHAMQLGCAKVLVLPPFYFKDVSEDGVFRVYAECIDRVGDNGLRLYLYNFPVVSGIEITTGILERLIHRYPATIAGLKDSSGEWSYVKNLLHRFPSLSVFSGPEVPVSRLLNAGGAGAISGMANVIPGLMRELVDARPSSPDDPLLATMRELVGQVIRHPVVPALKALIAHMQQQPSWERMRPPLMPLSIANKRHLIEAMEKAGLAVPPDRLARAGMQ